MKQLTLFVVCLCMSLNGFAQTAIPVLKVKASPAISVHKPILLDSTDVNKKAFEDKKLLQTIVSAGEVRESQTILTAAADSVLTLSNGTNTTSNHILNNTSTGDYTVQLLAFNMDADRYCEAKLDISATDMLEVYINGKREKAKETVEDSLQKAKKLSIDLTLEPHRYEVIIKRLATSDQPSELKAAITPDKKDSLAQIVLSTDSKRRIFINDILEGNRLTGASLSPTGQYYVVNTKNLYPGGKNTVLAQEVRELKTNKLITRLPSDVNPRWMKGKNQLIYSRKGKTDKDLVLIDIPSLKETVWVEDIPFDSYQVTPDAQSILISRREEIPEDTGDLKRVLSPSDRSGAFRGRNALYVYSLVDRTMQQILFGRSSIYIVDISRDSQKALLLQREEDYTKRPFSVETIYELDLKTLQLDSLLTDAFIKGANYSPGRNEILITGAAAAFNKLGENLPDEQISNDYDAQAYIYNLQTKHIEPVTKDFNPSIEDAEWSAYDNKIYFKAEDKDCMRIYQYNPKTAVYTLLDLPEDLIKTFQVADTQPVALFQGEKATNAYRLYSYDLNTKKSTLLDDPFAGQLDELALSPVESWNFTAQDGSTIEGRYLLPPNFDPAKKYPMIVYYYGGTSPTARTFEASYPLQCYAAQGYVVYTLNPSGTTGYGQEFAARHVNAWGKRTAGEIIEGTRKFASEHPFVDTLKIGCIGASYGGFMTQYLQTQTQLFAAAVSHAGISAISSYWGEGYWGVGYSGVASADSYPWNNPGLYVKQSPLFQADKINTPLLLLHGTVDTNVPIGESIQMYNALKVLGKNVEFVTVKDENHGITGYEHRIEWNKTIYAWFAKWLKEQPQWWEALYPER
ncbi:MAG: prolyl oligopeptidase family serine peptidase [Candidatus Symbiothrix sp.]|nr:prolyl oligopeptidase family serine peptidase [Candidatus Symbiothrix sp.]